MTWRYHTISLLYPIHTFLCAAVCLQPGHTVDVLDDDCWWQGVVQEVLNTRIKVLLTGERGAYINQGMVQSFDLCHLHSCSTHKLLYSI